MNRVSRFSVYDITVHLRRKQFIDVLFAKPINLFLKRQNQIPKGTNNLFGDIRFDGAMQLVL